MNEHIAALLPSALTTVPGHEVVESTPMDIDHEAVIRCRCGRAFVGSDWRVYTKWRDHLREVGQDVPSAHPAPRPWSWAGHHRRGRSPQRGKALPSRVSL